jgi:hypothetical protein
MIDFGGLHTASGYWQQACHARGGGCQCGSTVLLVFLAFVSITLSVHIKAVVGNVHANPYPQMRRADERAGERVGLTANRSAYFIGLN